MKDPVGLWDTTLKGKVTSTYGIVMSGDAMKLEGLRLLKEMLYSEIGKDELDRPKRLFHTIYDYQSILELKKWNSIGNFDRVSEMLIRAIQWKITDIEAAKELAHRKKVLDTTDNRNILKRDWF